MFFHAHGVLKRPPSGLDAAVATFRPCPRQVARREETARVERRPSPD
ncbi:hypothetical protein ACQ4WX_48260 [Streptomyces lasalocidi]